MLCVYCLKNVQTFFEKGNVYQEEAEQRDRAIKFMTYKSAVLIVPKGIEDSSFRNSR